MTRMFMIGIIVFILLIIIIGIVSAGGSSSVTERGLISATQRYMRDNPTMYPVKDDDTRTVNLSTLVSSGYISSGSSGASCSSYVIVTKLSSGYYYTPFIKCFNGNDLSPINQKIVGTVVTSGAGLYQENGKYLYRGENPKNYVMFKDNTIKFRILGLDENNYIKLILADSNYDYEVWDDRYNATTDRQTGINDFSVSRLKDYLDTYLNKMLDKKEKLIPDAIRVRLTKFDQCVGKINLETNSVDDCSTKAEGQMVGAITAMDYVRASLDENCSVSNTKNCQNYNFLNKSSWTISAYSGDDANAYYIDKNNGLKLSELYISRAVYPVITLRSDVMYISGTGTEADPYIVK